MLFFKKHSDKKEKKLETDIRQAYILNNALGESIKIRKDGLPSEYDLRKLRLNVVDFRPPKLGECFINKDYVISIYRDLSSIHNCRSFCFDNGCRIILSPDGDVVTEGENDQEALNLILEDPLPYFCGVFVKLRGYGIPVKDELIKLNIKIVDFNIPQAQQYFLSQYGQITTFTGDECAESAVNQEYKNGYRFILGKIDS